MNQIWNIARKELQDGLRNHWLLAISLLFSIMAMGIAWLGAATTGQLGFTSIPAIIASLASLATFLVPLIALLLAYDAIVGEEEGGTLTLMLTYPLSPGQILLGKFVGHGLILALATLLGFGSAMVAIGVLVEGISLELLLLAFIKFMASSTLLGWIFLGLAYLLSCKAGEKSQAAGMALGLWFMFVLVFDLALLALLVFSEGQFSPGLLPWLLLLNPTDIYRLLNLSGVEGDGGSLGVLALGNELPLSAPTLWLCLLCWVGLSLLLAYRAFLRRAP